MQEEMIKQSPVVVVGSGLAGLTSAYHLLKQNVPVILLEKTAKVGGNSAKASSGINGILTNAQRANNISDSFDSFFGDTKKSGGSLGDHVLQEVLVDESTRAVEWLQTDIGAGLNIVNRLGGHSQSRTHRSDGIPPGFEIISKLKKKVEEQEGFQLSLNSKLVGIDVKDSQIQGVSYEQDGEKKIVKTSNVIIATGGFGFSKELLKKYKPEFVSLPTTNGDQTLGEGQLLLEEIGGELIDMEQVQIHPTGFIKQDDRDSNWKFLAAESLRGVGGVLVNEHLERFVNELDTRDVVSQAILKQDGSRAYLILNEDMYNEFQFQIDFYMKMNLISKVDPTTKFGNRASTLVTTLNNYATKDQFNREYKKHIFTNITDSTPLFIGEVTPVVHFTMGGVKINEKAQVLNTKGEVIEGLYAAGEVSGGVHGQNRLGGNSLLECVVFGTRAANDVVSKL